VEQRVSKALRVVIVGGGFGGLNVARKLGGRALDVTLVDRRNYHLFQPLLYQVATGSLSPADIAAPLRHVLRRHRNVRVLLAEVRDIDVARKRIVLADGAADGGREVEYDLLVVAAGSRTSYFGHDPWIERAPGLKTIEDATRIRARVLAAFEAAERVADPAQRAVWTTFVIVGAGATGVELAGALTELARDTLAHEFRAVDPRRARVILIEGAERVLNAFPADLAQRAQASLERLGVDIWTRATVVDVGAERVRVLRDGRELTIETRTVIWAAGVRSSELSTVLHERAGAQLDSGGRVLVEPDLSVRGHAEIFVIGDLAHCKHRGEPLPGVAPVAMQQGSYVGSAILARARGAECAPFRYVDKGNMAVIGRSSAVVDLRGRHLSGFLAWMLWLFVHLMYLVGFANRLLVFLQWAWNYFTRNRTARLITNSVDAPAGAGTERPG
jgi:NADH dehydrogenase